MNRPGDTIGGEGEREAIEREIDAATAERVKAITEHTDATFKLNAANRRLADALRARTASSTREGL